MAVPPDAKLTLEQVKNLLAAARVEVETEERLPDHAGWKLTVRGRRVVVNVWDNGNWNLQGTAEDATLLRRQLRDAADAVVRRWSAVSDHLALGD